MKGRPDTTLESKLPKEENTGISGWVLKQLQTDQQIWSGGPLWSKASTRKIPSCSKYCTLIILALIIKTNFGSCVSLWLSKREYKEESLIYCIFPLPEAVPSVCCRNGHIPQVWNWLFWLDYYHERLPTLLLELMWILTFSTDLWSNKFYPMHYLGKASLPTHKSYFPPSLQLAVSLNLLFPIYLYDN